MSFTQIKPVTSMQPSEIVSFLKQYKFSVQNEKELQRQIETKFSAFNIRYDRECILDARNTPDFMLSGICVEVKIKGSAVSIYKQLERYAAFDRVQSIILVTNKSMTLPVEINNKPAYMVRLGKAWL